MDHISGAIEHRCAVLAFLEMSLHGGAQLRVRFAFQIVRDFQPYLLATDYHGLLPFPDGARLNQPFAKAGARISRSMSRARSRRVLTLANEMLNASALSSMLMCSTSRRRNTSRYFCPRLATALARMARNSVFSSASEGISRQSAKSRGA